VTGRLKLVAQAVTLAAVAGFLVLLIWKLTHQRHAPKVGSAAPAFTLARLGGGGSVSLASFRGHPVVLNFWASWCPPCKSEAAALERNWQQYRGRGITFIGVDDTDLTSDARTFVSVHGLTFEMLADGSGDVTRSYGISQLPETYVLDARGKVVAHLTGPIDDSGFASEFRAVLKEVS
jgi:cytochrome c biogenesis protein CcmG, thiol:disulfide interchange protein DsbE